MLPLLKVFATAFIIAVSTGNAFAQAPEIEVRNAADSILVSGATPAQDFGSVAVAGATSPLTFTINNIGNADLTGLTTAISGTGSGDFSVTTAPVSPVTGPSGNAILTVTFNPSISGVRNAAITITSNDADEGSFVVNLTGTGTVPEIAVENYLSANLTTPSAFDFGSVQVSSPLARTFTIRSTGTATLTGLGVTRSNGGTTGQFTLSALSPVGTSIAAGGFATFTVTFTPTSTGAKSAVITIVSNDADENPFEINLTGTGTVPDIDVQYPTGTSLTDGSSTVDFSTTPVGTPVTRDFTIKNLGVNTSLSITGASITTGSSYFTVTTAPATSVAGPSGSTPMVVRYNPTAFGNHTATLRITSNDPDEGTFDIELTGTGQAAEIGVLGDGGAAIADNGTQQFGNVSVSDNRKITFTIQNTGNIALTPVSFSWPNGSGDFDLVSPPSPSNSVAITNGTTQFAVNFSPTSGGLKTAVLRITTNDPDEGTYDITMSGSGNTPPSGTDAFGYRLIPTPVNAFSLNPATDPNVVNAADLAGDDNYQAVNLGFTFYLYDRPFTSCAASINGLLTFGSVSSSYSPNIIPTASSPNGFIAPFWTDLLKGVNSQIYYVTRGSAPNRVFVIEYVDMEEFGNASAKISFQVLLYEGSNSIEIQYKKVSGFSATRNVTTGIENFAGTTGIQHTSLLQRPAAGTAMLFTRPVVVNVESKYTRPDGTETDVGTLAIGLDPAIGIYKEPYESSKRFEAPEFIYLDKDFGVLTEVGQVRNLNDPAPYPTCPR